MRRDDVEVRERQNRLAMGLSPLMAVDLQADRHF